MVGLLLVFRERGHDATKGTSIQGGKRGIMPLFRKPSRRRQLRLSTWRAASALALSAALVPVAAAGAEKAKIRIVATVYPFLEFAREVAGDRGEASLLIPPGSEVHTWQPRAGDVLKLSACDLFIHVGLGLEPWADGLLRGIAPASPRVLEMGRSLRSAPGAAGTAGDPHLWLDFGLDLELLERIGEALSEMEPASAPLFKANAAAYASRLEDLDRRFREGLASCRARTVVLAGHAAFGRLFARYGLEQVPLYGTSPDAEPSPARMTEVVKLIRAKGIRVVYTEVGEPAKLADALRREVGARTLPLHPGHNPSASDLAAGRGFIEIMLDNLRSLRDGCGAI
jgi:zinc transport system substrate-binding protein